MDQRNINVMIGLSLLVAFLVWVATAELDYIDDGTGEMPTWASVLVWQGEQERSIKVHQGLDLQGGLQVVLEADLLPEQELQDGAMEAVRIVVDNRVNGLGVTEPLVQLQGERRLIVELPGVDNPELAISTIQETGLLEFVDAGFNAIPEGAIIRTSEGDPRFGFDDEGGETAEAAETTNVPDIYTPDTVYETVITGGDLDDVQNAGLNPTSRSVEIPFRLNESGSSKFGPYTATNIGEFLCIVLDKVVISCPVVQARIDTEGTITVGDSLQEGQALAIQLRYGALPVPLKVVENRTVGPTLGQDSVERSLRAGTIGLSVVLLFMMVYYRLPGFAAGMALVIYGLFNFALYKLIPVTITLPAATGFILSVGMAVDANILIFERMKEELRAGRSLRRAMELGFIRSWPSIRDSAISTLITCGILYSFGSNFGASIVKGFAITLALGVVTNIFTAVVVTRSLLRFVIGVAGNNLQNNSFLLGFKAGEGDAPTAPGWVSSLFDIVGRRRVYYVFSSILIAMGLVSMGFSFSQFGSPLKLSVDFTSGSLLELQFEQSVEPGQVRDIFASYVYVDPTTGEETAFSDTDVTTAEQLGRESILIRSKFLPEEAKVDILDQVESNIGPYTELRFDSVGPAIGREVGQAGLYAVISASIAILLFLVVAFRSVANAVRYGVAAVVAMAHDIMITAGIFAVLGLVLGWEMDALFLTAILTVIGYSVHDTIIVFDRLRENVPVYRNEEFQLVCNRSVLESVNRSIVTSLSTLFVVVSILAFGGVTVQQFIAILLIGIISGTYSSIFIAVPILVSWHQNQTEAA